MKRIIIIGLGNFGSTVATSLAEKGHDVIVIDSRENVVDRIGAFVSRAAVGDATQKEMLKQIGAAEADVGVVSTGDDITASILATMALNDLKVRDVIVKVVSAEHARVMQRLGVREVVFPERDSALALATRVSGSALLNYVSLGPDFSIQEMGVPNAWEGKTIRELDLRRRHDISIVALNDVLTDKINPTPDPDYVLKDTDTLLVVGTGEALARAAAIQ